MNQNDANYSCTQSLHELIRQVTLSNPHKIALVFQEQEMSYQELDEKSNRLAQYLIWEGLHVGDFVGVALDRSPEMLVTLLAIMKAGAAYIPLDPEYPDDRIRYILADASAKILITSKNYSKKFHHSPNKIFIENALAESLSFTVTPPPVVVSAKDLVYLLYTSGSTGKPKGVLIEHRSLVNLLYSMLELPGFCSGDILLAVTTIAFDIAGLELFLPLIVGGSIILADTETTRNGVELLRIMEEKKVSVMQATPATWKMLLFSGWKKKMDIKVLCCGEPLSRDLANQLIPVCASLWNMYGPTETTIYSTGKQVFETDEIITIGKPIHNTEVYILDNAMKPLPIGVTGEIGICGDGLARGYLNLEAQTKEKFIRHPLDASRKMYRTGDLGKLLPGGEIQCFGRIDSQIKIRGYRIEAGEIENTLQTIAGIQEAVVLCKKNKLNDPRLVAYIVPGHEREAEPSATGLKPAFINGFTKLSSYPSPAVSKEQVTGWKKSLAQKLPGYMVPSHFEILTSLPLTPNGKIDRNALPEPSFNTDKEEQVPVKLYTSNEKFIAGIWTDLLGIENIGLTDNFFELGGHSLIAIEVMTRIQNQTGKRLPPSTLFQYSTISKLAEVLENRGIVNKWKSLVPIKPTGKKDPLYIIHGAGLDVMIFNNIARYMDKDQPVYGVKAKGMDGDDETLEVIEEMAAFYISEIVQHNPAGPYSLLGFSAGSVIAFEMAKQLKAMNKEIKLLGMIDYDLEQPGKTSRLSKKIKKNTIQLFPRLFHVLKSFVQHPQKSLKFQLWCLKLRYISLLARLGFKEKIEVRGFYLDIQNAQEKHEFALKNYVVKPLDICIELFSSKIKVFYLEDAEFLGWKPYALKGIKIHKVPGDHDDMLLPPNNQEFAHVLQDVLNSKDAVADNPVKRSLMPVYVLLPELVELTRDVIKLAEMVPEAL